MWRKFEKSISFEVFREVCIAFFTGLLIYFLYPIFKGILLSSDGSINSGSLTAIVTILGLFYTLKIHKDNLEFQKRIALRKERLELIEEIRKEFIRFENFHSSFIEKIKKSHIFGRGVFDLYDYRRYTADQILHFPMVPKSQRSHIIPKSKEDISKIMDEDQSIIVNDLEKNINEAQLDNKEGLYFKNGFQTANSIIKIIDSPSGMYWIMRNEYSQKLDVASLKVSDEELTKLIPVEKIFAECKRVLEEIRKVISLRSQSINTIEKPTYPSTLLLTQLKDLLIKYLIDKNRKLDEELEKESEVFKQKVIKKINSIFNATYFDNIKKDFETEINKLLEQSKLE